MNRPVFFDLMMMFILNIQISCSWNFHRLACVAPVPPAFTTANIASDVVFWIRATATVFSAVMTTHAFTTTVFTFSPFKFASTGWAG
jgi:hypothetical protein